MADVSIDATVSTSTARGMRSVVFTTALIGYWFYIDSDGSFKYSKTTDGGATWGAATSTGTSTLTNIAFDVWYDRWTPGDAGTLIHYWVFDSTNDVVGYWNLQTTNDTNSSFVNVFTGASAVAGRGAFVSGTKTRSGYLYCAYDIDAGAEKGLHRSTNAGVSWSASLSSTFVGATIDQCLLFPATGSGDDNDMVSLMQIAASDIIKIRNWDSSAATFTDNATTIPMIENTTDLTGQMGFSGSVRNSDGHIILVACNDRDTVTADMVVWDITPDLATAPVHKTDITANIDDNYNPAVFIDQNTNRIYVAYNGKKDGSEVIGTTTKIYYVYSDDSGSTWSAEQPYQEGAAAAAFQVWAPLSGSRFYVGWRVGTTLVGNKVNSVDVTPVPVIPLPSLITQPMIPARRRQ
jgi:hypothetical protein